MTAAIQTTAGARSRFTLPIAAAAAHRAHAGIGGIHFIGGIRFIGSIGSMWHMRCTVAPDMDDSHNSLSGNALSESQRLYLGCAGWSIPKEHNGLFPAEGSHLERYAARNHTPSATYRGDRRARLVS